MLGHCHHPVRRLLAAGAAALCLAGLPATGAAPANAAGLPGRTAWLKATERAMTGAQSWVAYRVDHQRAGEKLAVVMDIDNTSLQSHYAWPRAVPATLRYARYARSRGVTVFFATGRPQSQLADVAAKLRTAGFDYAQICGRNPGETLVQSKVRCRTGVQTAGYSPIAMVGNRSTDFTGGHWERSWRLPNYGNRLG